MSCVNTHGQTVRAASRAVTLLGFILSFALAQGAFAQSARNSLDQHDQEVSGRLAAKFDDGTQQSQERVFFENFKRAVAQGDFSAVADMMRYPIPVDLHGKKLRFCSKRNFLAHKDEIFTPKTIAAIKSLHYSDMNRFRSDEDH